MPFSQSKKRDQALWTALLDQFMEQNAPLVSLLFDGFMAVLAHPVYTAAEMSETTVLYCTASHKLRDVLNCAAPQSIF